MKRVPSLLLSFLALAAAGASCEPGTPPTVTVGLDGIPEAMSSVLVVPPSGFVVNVTITPGYAPVDPESLLVGAARWGGGFSPALEGLFEATPTGAVATIPPGLALASGTQTLFAVVHDTAGRIGTGSISFAVRDFGAGGPPIGQGQQIWLDFEADRDATPGPDFAVDLEHFGLASPAAPTIAADARAVVTQAVLERVREAYGQDADGAGENAVAVDFSAVAPGSGDVTRICVGGEDPGGGSTIGSIQLDPRNSARSSVECGTIPPTGVFPRELLVYQNQSSFRTVFDPLRPEAGGVRLGEYVWDAFVLDPAFDPQSAPPEAAARHAVVMEAIEAFANALGSIVAHEAGHALGLVPPGPPGGGLYGGGDGAAYTHALNPDGSTPSENFLMKAGNAFTFAKLAGLGYPLPVFRPIELAYLRDQLVLAPQVTQLLAPPLLTSVAPWQITGSSQIVTIRGSGFAAIPSVRLRNPLYTYPAIGEALQSGEQMTCWVIPGQVPDGTYDLEVTNPDGQQAVLPAAVEVW